MDLANKRVVVTGGYGFLGCRVVRMLEGQGAIVKTFHSTEFDLTDKVQVDNMYRHYMPEVVIHLAAVVGGIGINQKKPGTFFYKNLMMSALLIEHARLHNLEKFVGIGTVCAYPKFTPVPFKETDLWNGYPEETNAPYGLAKKMMLVQSQAYRQEFGLNSIFLLPVNLYGPNDNFNPDSSHVIPALIRNCLEAKESNQSLTCWGTGTASREFLYVDDAAEAIIMATRLYDGPDPVNIGSGHEITIHDLVHEIAALTGFTGDIEWDNSKPDGQPRRRLDTTMASQLFGFTAKTTLTDGLKRTVAWYIENANRHSNISR